MFATLRNIAELKEHWKIDSLKKAISALN